jgi:hypothetical protein
VCDGCVAGNHLRQPAEKENRRETHGEPFERPTHQQDRRCRKNREHYSKHERGLKVVGGPHFSGKIASVRPRKHRQLESDAGENESNDQEATPDGQPVFVFVRARPRRRGDGNVRCVGGRDHLKSTLSSSPLALSPI